MQQLNKDEIVNFQFSNTDSEIIFLQPREDDKTINRISRIVQQQNDLKELQIKAVIDYVNNDHECKNKILLNYFGEKTTKNCGMCSYCISNKKSSNAIDVKAITHNIILLLEEEPLNSRKIVETLPFTEQHVLDVLKLMVENNILIITATNTYKIKHT